jgi:hypothetical protein
MVGVNVLLSRAKNARGADYLGRAEAIARRALRELGQDRLARQPPAFNAIFFRNLLRLHAATAHTQLRNEILAAARRYAETAWASVADVRSYRRRVLTRVSLTDESAIVQLLALLAWDHQLYDRLT